MNEIKIPPATKNDIPAILPIWKKLMDEGGTQDETFGTSKDWKKHITAHLEKLLKDERARILVVKKGKKIIGYAILQITNNVPVFKQFDRGFITDLCIHEDYRRQGIGEKLLLEAFAWYRSLGIKRVELAALEKNVLGRKFWKHMGFQDFIHKMYIRI